MADPEPEVSEADVKAAAAGMENMRFALYGHDKHVARAVFRHLNDCCLLTMWHAAQPAPLLADPGDNP